MARRSLRPQLNQIRAWVRQGRTDAWIAHQLEISASELREFRRQHDLNAEEDDPSTSEMDLRDEIEAEIEAATAEEAEEPSDEDTAAEAEGEDGDGDGEDDDGEGEDRPRRRRRRGRRGRRRRRQDLEATFDHGEEEGFGLWLDPSVQDDNVYSENWKGHRAVTVTIEPDRIVIRRVEADSNGASAGSEEPDED
jgi:hypothetical protein